MPTLSEIFDKRKILLYQNESLDLDHYYQEPYQDENDEIKDMGKPFETDESKKIRTLDLSNEDRTYSSKARKQIRRRRKRENGKEKFYYIGIRNCRRLSIFTWYVHVPSSGVEYV